MARWLDKQPQTIINWLEGTTNPTARNLQEIVTALYETYRIRVTAKQLTETSIADLIDQTDAGHFRPRPHGTADREQRRADHEQDADPPAEH